MEKVLEYIKDNNLDYMTQSELAKFISETLNISNTEAFTDITNLLESGELVLTGGQKIVPIEKLNLKKGVIVGNYRGFAFCKLIDSDEPDVFIPHIKLKHALNKDIVLVKAITRNEKQEGEVFKIIKRNDGNIVGTLMLQNDKFGFVKPDDDKNFCDIFVKLDRKFKVQNLDKVVVRIVKFDEKGKNPEGKIMEVLGADSSRGINVLSIIREYNLYEEFEPQVLEDAKKVPENIRPEDRKDRVDFTKEDIVTIDGDDSKDFDDAVGIEKHADGTWTLGVHIADVSHYVKVGTPLDQEAYKRGTSVYFYDRVLPMLPVQLSNGICSLNPNVERLVLSVIMELDANGNLKSEKICKGIIKSAARMTYNKVYAILQDDPEISKQYEKLVPKFKQMAELHELLYAKRKRRGALDLDVPEPVIIQDENGKVVDIEKRQINTAHKLIESFMLLANETVAKVAFDKKIPCVYRVHEQPDAIKMRNFFDFAGSLGLNIKGQPEDVKPKELQTLLFNIDGQPYEQVINKVMLRSLQKARYSSKNLGHFGLAAEFYCHFTSPIRRYPDLMVHRVLKNLLLSKPDENTVEFYTDFCAESSINSSEREKLAETAERAIDDLAKAEFMQDKIGEVYDGIISGVTAFGVFVELDNTVEGLCGEADLPFDTYMYNEKQYLLKGSKHSYQLGQKIRVSVVAVNLQKRQINFKMVE